MRNKARFEFVDELRKINTIEKMGYVQSFNPEDFEEHKQDKTKFIRYKKHLDNEQMQFYREVKKMEESKLSTFNEPNFNKETYGKL